MAKPTASDQDYFIIFQEDNLIMDEAYQLLQDPSLKEKLTSCHEIGRRQNHPIYCAEWPQNIPIPSNFITLPIKKAITHLSTEWFYFVARGKSIIQWDKNHQFCGRCGKTTIRMQHTFEKQCPSCELLFFPRISPSVIVLIEKDDYLLMARSYHFIPGVYGLIAGFVEAGESLEEAVHREVYEEVGLVINNLRYIGSQPWPFPDSLVIAYRADFVSGELKVDHNELEIANWYRYDDLPGRPSSPFSIAWHLIDQFINEKREQHKEKI